MFFNKDRKIWRNLATCAIILPDKQIQQINETVQDIQFSEIETNRLRFCLSILNLASIFWCINFYEKNGGININRVRKIIDNTLDTFMNKFINDKTTIRTGDYIVDNDASQSYRLEWRDNYNYGHLGSLYL